MGCECGPKGIRVPLSGPHVTLVSVMRVEACVAGEAGLPLKFPHMRC